MTIAILETGRPPGDLSKTFGDYPAMFRGLLGGGFEYETFKSYKGEAPADPAAYEALLVTGSPAGVYDGLPWIADLEALLREAAGKTKMVGVCFGHQVMASAFGGQVIKSPKGWGIGLHQYRLTDAPAWADADAIALPASHQDQVVTVPASARVIGGSDFNPNGVLEYDFGGLSMQLHPEFDPAYERALLQRRTDLYDPALLAEAMASLDQPNDNSRVGGWIRRFLHP
jgi:GMP synthase-like glutamine amidotransferase